MADHSAAPGTSQLTVSKGQQVEIIEYTSSGETDFCLVRLNPQTDDGATQEGLVPISVLNPPPGSGPKSKKEKDATVDQGWFFFVCILNIFDLHFTEHWREYLISISYFL